MIDFVIPDDVRVLYRAAAPLYRIHSARGDGLEIIRRWEVVEGKRVLTDKPTGLILRWGMRPLNVGMDGWVSVTAGWDLRRPKNPAWIFDGFGTSLNYPGHTSQRALFKWSGHVPFERLLHWVTDEAIERFEQGCMGDCSHRDPAVREGEVLTEGGFTTSGAPALFQRVW